jgi:hypothetical protein
MRHASIRFSLAIQQIRCHPPRAKLGRIALQRLAEDGINADQGSIRATTDTVVGLSEEDRRRRSGQCFVLEHAAPSLFSTPGSYFAA